jgi:hypothetical protein
MTFDEVLKLKFNIRGVDKIKIVRHQDARTDINQIYESDRPKFDSYQGAQGRDLFNCDYIASFLGAENNTAKFVGLYRVVNRLSENEFIKKHPTYDYWKKLDLANYFYDLSMVDGFDDLVDRVIIDWGKSTRSWVQNNLKKEVVEILPAGYVKEFRGYLELLLTFSELKRIIGNPTANKMIHNRLTAVNGVYLIVDSQTGNQYVGSTYNQDGIWGRWRVYANTGHGNNKKLKELLKERGQNYQENFNFSILQTLPTGLSEKEVLDHERLNKNKLGKKATALNAN